MRDIETDTRPGWRDGADAAIQLLTGAVCGLLLWFTGGGLAMFVALTVGARTTPAPLGSEASNGALLMVALAAPAVAVGWAGLRASSVPAALRRSVRLCLALLPVAVVVGGTMGFIALTPTTATTGLRAQLPGLTYVVVPTLCAILTVALARRWRRTPTS